MNIRLYLNNGYIQVKRFNTLTGVHKSYYALDIAYHQVMLSDDDPLINEWNGKEWVSNGLCD